MSVCVCVCRLYVSVEKLKDWDVLSPASWALRLFKRESGAPLLAPLIEFGVERTGF